VVSQIGLLLKGPAIPEIVHLPNTRRRSRAEIRLQLASESDIIACRRVGDALKQRTE
jgi:hypothetical protein